MPLGVGLEVGNGVDRDVVEVCGGENRRQAQSLPVDGELPGAGGRVGEEPLRTLEAAQRKLSAQEQRPRAAADLLRNDADRAIVQGGNQVRRPREQSARQWQTTRDARQLWVTTAAPKPRSSRPPHRGPPEVGSSMIADGCRPCQSRRRSTSGSGSVKVTRPAPSTVPSEHRGAESRNGYTPRARPRTRCRPWALRRYPP